MKSMSTVKGLTLVTIASFMLINNSFAVEPLSDNEMSDLVVLDPFGATAAGGQIDTTLEGRSLSAESVDETNQALANDPNTKLNTDAPINYQFLLGDAKVDHLSSNFQDGIQIESMGSVGNVYIDQLIDNTGANRGSRAIENINIDSSATIYNFR